MTHDNSLPEGDLPHWLKTIGEFIEENGSELVFFPALFAIVSLFHPVERWGEWTERTAYGKVLLVLGVPIDLFALVLGAAWGVVAICLCLPTYVWKKKPKLQPAIYKERAENE